MLQVQFGGLHQMANCCDTCHYHPSLHMVVLDSSCFPPLIHSLLLFWNGSLCCCCCAQM